MSGNLQGGIKPGSTSVSLAIKLWSSETNEPLTGKIAADLVARYYRQGAAAIVTISLSDLTDRWE